ncbi:MAG: hypothetical protein M3463_04305 [Verrucomicrobiota bacterium]|nr:hypothetical protein [Verrucomicrobiota bacterium]
MNPNPPPLKQPGPLSLRRYGWLVILVTLILMGVLAVCYAVLQTAMPFKAFAVLIKKGNPNLKMTGVSGNLATGPSVASITWGTDPGQRSEILELRVEYNGLADAWANKRLIIEDVGVRKAHIDLTDISTYLNDISTRVTTGSGRSEPASGAAFPRRRRLESVEIRRVLIENVLLSNRHTRFQLSIPRVEWTGFKMTAQGVELGELHVESDRLTLHTGPGRTRPLAGESVTFQKSLTGTVQPLLDAAIRQPISFTLDFTFVPEVPAPAYQFSAADGKLEMATTADGGHALHVRKLDLPALLDATELYGPAAADFPSDLVLEAVAAHDGPLKIVSGSFRLGVATFQIEPAEFAAADRANATVQAVLRTVAGEIRWSLPLKDVPIQFRPRLSASAELAPAEILARVFAGKPHAELDAEEKRAIDVQLPVYFPVPIP